MLDQVESTLRYKGDIGGIIPYQHRNTGGFCNGSSLVPSTAGLADPALGDLLQKLSDLQLKYTQTKKIVPENNPGCSFFDRCNQQAQAAHIRKYQKPAEKPVGRSK